MGRARLVKKIKLPREALFVIVLRTPTKELLIKLPIFKSVVTLQLHAILITYKTVITLGDSYVTLLSKHAVTFNSTHTHLDSRRKVAL